jgi:hypothetical protein
MNSSKLKTTEAIREERRQLKEQYGQLFDAVSSLLFRHDPIGINFETNADEYDPEAGTILPRLRTCKTAADVQRVVYEEFVRWFDSNTAGRAAGYSKIAEEIWDLWQKSRLA